LSLLYQQLAAILLLYSVLINTYNLLYTVYYCNNTDMLMKMKKKKVVTLIYQHWMEAVSLVMRVAWGVWEVCIIPTFCISY
jgi:hypothetical protein